MGISDDCKIYSAFSYHVVAIIALIKFDLSVEFVPEQIKALFTLLY